MCAPFFSLSCDSYKQNLFSGFASLQERQEFVDLTLAADGHLVKVHKNIMALASPYINDILKSTSSDNLVIFLNNVSHNVLKYLLEYIYHGETRVPQESLESFLQLATSLNIAGMSNTSKNHTGTPNMMAPVSGNPPSSTKKPKVDLINQNSENRVLNLQKEIFMNKLTSGATVMDNKSSINSDIAACITINSGSNIEVQNFVENIPIISNLDKDHQSIDADVLNDIRVETIQEDATSDWPSETIVNDKTQSMDIDIISAPVLFAPGKSLSSETAEPLSGSNAKLIETPLLDLNCLDKESVDALKNNIMQYSVTERGAVQIIVNRYIYLSHHESHRGRKHRWRCIDYRKLRCPALIDSIDNRLVQRKGVHNHGFHDDKIYKKHQKGVIFHNYKHASEANNKNIDSPSSRLDFDDSEGEI